MAQYLVSHHPAAESWAQRVGGGKIRVITRVDFDSLGAGDVVMGCFPRSHAAIIASRGALVWNLLEDEFPQCEQECAA